MPHTIDVPSFVADAVSVAAAVVIACLLACLHSQRVVGLVGSTDIRTAPIFHGHLVGFDERSKREGVGDGRW